MKPAKPASPNLLTSDIRLPITSIPNIPPGNKIPATAPNAISDNDISLEKSVNKTIYNVTKNLENFQYNVVIANIHEIYNNLNKNF